MAEVYNHPLPYASKSSKTPGVPGIRSFGVNRTSEIGRNLVIGAAMAALLSLGAVAQGTGQMSSSLASNGPSGSTLTAADRTFIKKAAEGGQAEVELGQLAAPEASSD